MKKIIVVMIALLLAFFCLIIGLNPSIAHVSDSKSSSSILSSTHSICESKNYESKEIRKQIKALLGSDSHKIIIPSRCIKKAKKYIQSEKKGKCTEITKVSINFNDHLIITLNDNSFKDIGKIKRDKTSFKRRNFKVLFKDTNGEILKTQIVSLGKSAQAPKEPFKKGFTFKGWDKDFNNISSDMVITAMYVKSKMPFIKVNSKYNTLNSKDVDVAVSLRNNPGFLTMALSINYNSNVLKLKGVSNGSNFSDYNFTSSKNKQNGCTVAWFATDVPKEIVNGEIVILHFSVSSKASKVSCPVIITCPGDGSTLDGNKRQFVLPDAQVNIIV